MSLLIWLLTLVIGCWTLPAVESGRLIVGVVEDKIPKSHTSQT